MPEETGFKKIKGVVVYILEFEFDTKVIILATPKKAQEVTFLSLLPKDSLLEEVSTYELIKLWPHSTKRISRNFTTRKLVTEELKKRGRSLIPNGNKRKWKLPKKQEC
jgi:hypothetical protein